MIQFPNNSVPYISLLSLLQTEFSNPALRKAAGTEIQVRPIQTVRA